MRMRSEQKCCWFKIDVKVIGINLQRNTKGNLSNETFIEYLHSILYINKIHFYPYVCINKIHFMHTSVLVD